MQGNIGGATDYSVQSYDDILKDILYWIDEAKKMVVYLNGHLHTAKDTGFWKNVDCDFQATLQRSINFLNTIVLDLQEVACTIRNDCVSEREVKLLRNIGYKAVEFNDEYGEAYHKNNPWQQYDNPDFKVVENMYDKGRDFFVSLQDAVNASSRLKDYVKTDHSNKTTNVIFNGNVSGSQIQVSTENSVQNDLSKSFPYDDALTTLQEINNYKENLANDLGSTCDDFFQKLDEILDQTQKKENPSIIQRGLNVLRNLLIEVSGNIIASGAVQLLDKLPLN